MIPLPTNSSEATGSNATNEVLSDRISTWFIERFTMREYVSPRSVPTVGRVLLHLVEHDDGVVEREPEDGQERHDRARRHLEARHRVDADGDEDVVDHGDDRGERHLPLEAEGEIERDQNEEARSAP